MPLSNRSHLALVAATGLMVSGSTFACADRAPDAGTVGGEKPPQRIAQAPPHVSLEPLPNKEFLQKNGVLLIYPRAGAEINAPSTFFVGSATPGSSLTLNGVPIRMNSQGFFAHVAQLKRGQNQFALVVNGQSGDPLTIKVKRPPAPSAVTGTATIDQASAQPSEDVGVTTGDIVPFAVRAAPGSAVAVVIGTKKIALTSTPKSRVNLGLNTTFGNTYQAGVAKDPNYYAGFYKIQAGDNWDHVAPKFVASHAGKTEQFVSKKTITIFSQPRVLQTAHDETIVRLGPGQARTTPLPEGVRMLVDGYYGGQTRCELAAGKHVWIAREDLKEDSDPGRAPLSVVKTMNFSSDANSVRLVIPLNQRLPFQIEQSINPNRLVLQVFGATADTDWIGPDYGQEGGMTPGNFTDPATMINGLAFGQSADRIYKVTMDLRLKQQWGFWGDYEGTNLVLHARKPPKFSGGGLRDLIICVDPGHGGKETGAFGLSGVRESQINLSIGIKLKELLENEGAKVIMTRTTDDIEVPLPDRVNTAVAANADMLISVHNNSLPDGRDPWKERGTSTYYYQPQSLAFARSLKDAVASATRFPDYGTRWQNLALCRPSKMLACLVEVGFMIHPDEYGQLLQPSTHQRAASGIVTGVKNFLHTNVIVAPAKPGTPAPDGSTTEVNE